MKKKIIHKRKGAWRWPSKPLCNIHGDRWLMKYSKNWADVTCARCLKSGKQVVTTDRGKVIRLHSSYLNTGEQ